MKSPVSPWQRWSTALLLCLACVLPAMAAVDEDDLLPVDQAFVLSAKASATNRIEVNWKIADGYYLYRHRTKVVSVGAAQLGAIELPHGTPHDDEFFGKVETFRKHLTGSVPVVAANGASVTLKISYQGCADAGVCYPPQSRSLTVALPAGTASRVGPETAVPAQADAGFAALGKSLGGASPLAVKTGGASDALPLPPEQAFKFEAIADGGNTLLLRFTPARGYYLYRDNTQLTLAAEGITLESPRWPQGVQHRDEHFGNVVVYFDSIDVPVPLRRTSTSAQQATLTATFQGCQNDGICYPPMTRTVRVALPVGELATSPAATPAMAASTAAAAAIAAPSSMTQTPIADGNAAATSAAALPADVPRTLPPADILGSKPRQGPGVLLALLLALAGGLVLNLMPCVLPVLTLKALSLAGSGDRARSHALWYTAGVLSSFMAVGALVLALRATGQALGWGFQLQQPLVIGVLAYVMFAVGLSLSGVFSLGHRLAGAGQSLAGRSGPVADFFTGVLAVVIASPCTAPFMAVALAFAFAASVPLALLVFAALGLGLALPFLLIGFVPSLARRLPQPGAWMETLKHVLAFPMYLTAVWLLWVLGKQRGIDAVGLALVGLVLLALAAWWLERLRFRRAPVSRTLAIAVLLLALAPLVLADRLPLPQTASGSTAIGAAEPYSAARLAQLRGEGRVVFVDMTADWCVTCKANEKAVLSRPAFRAAMDKADAVLMQGDWTNVDPAITAFLEAHHAVGVPLYVVFPKTGAAGEVLPTVLTTGMVEDALARAAR